MTDRKRTHVQREAAEQEALFQWAAYLSAQYPELSLMYHIPNGGSRNVAEAANLKRQGVKAGVPDICLPVARHGFHGLYIEMKAGNNRPSEYQSQWLKSLGEQGYQSVVCYGWREAADVIGAYLAGGAE